MLTRPRKTLFLCRHLGRLAAFTYAESSIPHLASNAVLIPQNRLPPLVAVNDNQMFSRWLSGSRAPELIESNHEYSIRRNSSRNASVIRWTSYNESTAYLSSSRFSLGFMGLEQRLREHRFIFRNKIRPSSRTPVTVSPSYEKISFPEEVATTYACHQPASNLGSRVYRPRHVALVFIATTKIFERSSIAIRCSDFSANIG